MSINLKANADGVSGAIQVNGVDAIVFGASGITSNVMGALNNVQYFTASGTYTPTPGTSSVIVEVLGGGGNGGSAASVNLGALTVGGSGGGAGYAIKKISSAFAGLAVTVGGVSGTSSFGALVSATGGGVGQSVSGNGAGGTHGTAGIGSNGDANYKGGTGLVGNLGATCGGSSPKSAGAEAPTASSIVGNAAPVNSGAGGSGGRSAGSTTVYAGGNGGTGLVVIWEYK